ncbi:hypothetical protein HDU93_004557, partial [Gonapodya sp. JEL0774]
MSAQLSELDELRLKLETTQSELLARGELLSNRNSVLEQLQRTNEELRKASETKEANCLELQQKLICAAHDMDGLTLEALNTQGALKELANTRTGLETAIVERDERIVSLELSVNVLQKAVGARDKKIRSLKVAIGDRDSKLEERNESIRILEVAQAEQSAIITREQTRVVDLQSGIDALTISQNSKAKEIKDLHRRLMLDSNKIQELEGVIEALQSKITESHGRHCSLESALRETADQCADLEARITYLNGQLDEISATCSSKDSELLIAKAQMSELQVGLRGKTELLEQLQALLQSDSTYRAGLETQLREKDGKISEVTASMVKRVNLLKTHVLKRDSLIVKMKNDQK